MRLPMAERALELPPGRQSEGTICDVYPEEEEQRTRQSESQSADINFIVKKYEVTGVLPVEERAGVFMDISDMPTFQAALDQVARANEYFMSLPPDVRAVFGNEPAEMLDAWKAGRHGDVFERIGLLERVPAEAPAAGAASPPA